MSDFPHPLLRTHILRPQVVENEVKLHRGRPRNTPQVPSLLVSPLLRETSPFAWERPRRITTRQASSEAENLGVRAVSCVCEGGSKMISSDPTLHDLHDFGWWFLQMRFVELTVSCPPGLWGSGCFSSRELPTRARGRYYMICARV